eukprot:COSAG06_NODE_36475_length_447_cov_0.278736_1_plen_85_part_10
MVFFVAVVVVVVVVARRPNTSNGFDDGVPRTGVGRGARTDGRMQSQQLRLLLRRPWCFRDRWVEVVLPALSALLAESPWPLRRLL